MSKALALQPPDHSSTSKRFRRGVSWLQKALVCLALWPVFVPGPVWACATCFGKSDSQMAKGMNAGIFTLLCCILSVLVAISIFFFYILRRAARLAAQAPVSVPPLSHPTHS